MSSEKSISILSISPEILGQIGPHLTNIDAARLRCTCLYLSRVFAPFLIDTVGLRLSNKLSSVKPPCHPIPFVPIPDSLVQHVKTLFVMLQPNRIGIPHDDQNYQSEVNVLRKEITRFTSLRRVDIGWTSVLFAWDVQKHLDRAVLERDLLLLVGNASRNTLTRLGIRHSCMFPEMLPPPPNFESFTQLTELHIVHQDDRSTMPLFKPLLQLNNTLEKLAIKISQTWRAEDIHLRDIFPSRSSAPFLSLRSISLHGDINCSNDSHLSDLPDFPNLRCLFIDRMEVPPGRNLDGFWDVLRTRKTKLEYLFVTYGVNAALMDYLTSFQGLQRLHLDELPGEGTLFDCTRQLITVVLPHHALTLRMLTIHLPCLYLEGILASTQNTITVTWPSPKLFLQLEDLSVRTPSNWDFSLENAQNLLNWLEQFPALRHAGTLWKADPHPFTAASSAATVIMGQLVGRTGRPKVWSIYGLPWSSWQIEPLSNDEWTFKFVKSPTIL
ncbi:hypothetical protein AX16_002266 [Volvariella volvacea WC 439]|nr:hypothetical protein AX16_002266 [Volvariella volvacea WC 439]